MSLSFETLLSSCSKHQIKLINDILIQFRTPIESWRLNTSDVITENVLAYIGDILKLHHTLSAEPFTKDKFEHALLTASIEDGREAKFAPRGNPGYDLIIDNTRFSLKTQADKSLKENSIHISKFMELGKGDWDLQKLTSLYLGHLNRYDRIFTLRALIRGPLTWFYELVEIPKALLLDISNGEYSIVEKSKQYPKPGYYHIKYNEEPAFNLYFDGGSERKLQIQKLQKKLCQVHATWKFTLINPD